MVDSTIRIKVDGSGASADVSKLDGQFKGLKSTVSAVAGAVASVLAINQLRQYSDNWIKIGNQIRQATKNIDQFAGVQQRIFAIAQETRSDVEGIAVAYQRLANSVADFGVSQADVLRVTEGLTKAFKANGASAAEVSSVLVQLGQGLGTGALQGDELRSVLESSLPVARAIAKEFGVSTGELKKLGEQGKLTSDRVFKALIAGADDFEKQFAKAIPTAAEQFQTLENSATRLVGEFSLAIGSSESLGSAIGVLTGYLDQLSNAIASGAAGKFGEIFVSQAQVIGRDVTSLLQQVLGIYRKFSVGLLDDTNITTQDISDAFVNIIPNIRSFVQLATVEFAVLLDKASAYGEAIATSLNPFDDKDRFDARAGLKERLTAIEQVRDASISAIIEENNVAKTATAERLKEIQQLQFSYEKLKATQVQALSTVAVGNNQLGVSTAAKKEEKKVDVAGEIERENAIIEQSLISRNQLYSTYSAMSLDIFANDIDQKKAQLEISIGERRIREEEQFQQDLAKMQERRLQILDNEKLSDDEKTAAVSALYTQEQLLEQAHQDELTRIAQEAAAERKQIAMQERVNQIATMQGYFSTALNLASAFGSKSEKSQKRFRRTQVIIDTAAGITRAYAENDFYTATGIALFLAANGKRQLDAINSSNSIPTTASASPAVAPSTPSPTQQNTPQQKVINVDIADDTLLTGAAFKKALKSVAEDSDTAVIINSSLESGRRMGAI